MTEPIDITQLIANLFATLNVDIPSEDADLCESGLMDSLVLVEFLSQLEEQMGITVAIDELEPYEFSTIRRIRALVLSLDMARG
jgi:acyl carrier protein